jgi:hypothetical protein
MAARLGFGLGRDTDRQPAVLTLQTQVSIDTIVQ